MDPLDTTRRLTTHTPDVSGDDSRLPEIIGGAALSAFVLFSNLVLILALVRSDHRRHVSFNLHVVNLSLMGLVMGALVLPLTVDFQLQGMWSHGDNLCHLWLVAELVSGVGSIMVMVSLVFDRFVLFSCPLAAEGCCKYVLSALLLVLPWLAACGSIVPVYMVGQAGAAVNEDSGVCYLDLDRRSQMVLAIACFCVPTLLVLALLVVTSLTWCYKKEELRDMYFSEERQHKGWQVLSAWLLTLAVVTMWLPSPVLQLLSLLLETTWPAQLRTATVWIARANSGLNPILWMVMPRLREGVKALCTCCCRSKYRYDEEDIFDDETHQGMIEFSAK